MAEVIIWLLISIVTRVKLAKGKITNYKSIRKWYISNIIFMMLPVFEIIVYIFTTIKVVFTNDYADLIIKSNASITSYFINVSIILFISVISLIIYRKNLKELKIKKDETNPNRKVYCKKCGYELTNSTDFCTNCGYQIKQEEQ